MLLKILGLTVAAFLYLAFFYWDNVNISSHRDYIERNHSRSLLLNTDAFPKIWPACPLINPGFLWPLNHKLRPFSSLILVLSPFPFVHCCAGLRSSFLFIRRCRDRGGAGRPFPSVFTSLSVVWPLLVDFSWSIREPPPPHLWCSHWNPLPWFMLAVYLSSVKLLLIFLTIFKIQNDRNYITFIH